MIRDGKARIFIEEFIDSRAVDRHGIQLFSRLDSIELLEYIADHKIQLYGIDALKLLGDDGIQPDMEYDFDFDTSSIRDAIEVIKTLDDRYHFEFLGLGGPEWVIVA